MEEQQRSECGISRGSHDPGEPGHIAAGITPVGQATAAQGWAPYKPEPAVLVLYLIGSPIYWLGGKRRLIGVLRTRAPGDEDAEGMT